ncbi:MAG: phage tail sheath family protein [Chloroflexi bacterium]|nr:phage tail sheath family protein [Chloroflexota bacterium]
MSYAVRDFFLNGGSQAVIVRLFNPFLKTAAERAAFQNEGDSAKNAADTVAAAAVGGDPDAAAAAARGASDTIQGDAGATDIAKAAAATVATAAEAAAAIEGATVENVTTAATTAAENIAEDYPVTLYTITVGTLTFEAASPGAWGNYLRARVDKDVSEDVADRYDLTTADLFNLEVSDTGTGTVEQYTNLSLKDTPRRVDRVLKEQSTLIRWGGASLDDDPIPAIPTIPVGQDDLGDEVVVLEDALADARQAYKDAKNARVDIEASGEGDLDQAKQDEADAKEAVATARQAVLAKLTTTDGLSLEPADYIGEEDDKTGLYALEKTAIFNLLCIPPVHHEEDIHITVYQAALPYCVRRRAMLIVDSPISWGANPETAAATAADKWDDLGLSGTDARNAALYFPRVKQFDSLRDNQIKTFVPCGIIAGVMARTDVQRGVWKAPAGIDASLNGIQGLQVVLTDDENGMLNPLGINCARNFPIIGNVVWGARTLRGADQLADEYKYVPVRRLALYIEETLLQGTQWAVFEPNDEPLWGQLRQAIGSFMHSLFTQGAFQGQTPDEAYLVKCDSETTTQYDIDRGIVNVVVGFAPLKPAEFVIIKVQQLAGQSES